MAQLIMLLVGLGFVYAWARANHDVYRTSGVLAVLGLNASLVWFIGGFVLVATKAGGGPPSHEKAVRVLPWIALWMGGSLALGILTGRIARSNRRDADHPRN